MELGSAEDQDEGLNSIEPTRLEDVPEAIADAVAELSAASAILGFSLQSTTVANLAVLVRVMNAYYSNLIEGYDTKPRDIERAFLGNFDRDLERRNLQLQAAAHVRVQTEIDLMAADGSLPEPASLQFIRWLHLEFYRDAPEEMLRVRRDNVQMVMEPGQWRRLPQYRGSIGRHIPPASDRVDDLMRHFEESYRLANMGKAVRILAIAASHHRFNYIHPFAYGNGRVSRLLSHAMALKAGIGAQGLWSISRGLARGLESRGDYKVMMDYADTPRQGSIDGKGNLSQRALREFTLWFLKVCLNQVNFMTSLFDLDNLSSRLGTYVERSEFLKPEASKLLQEALRQGQFERGEAPRLTGLAERTARRVLNDLINEGLLASPTPKTPVSLRFPAAALESLFPRLYPEV
jgi:Fic family protein